ncbi:MAG TPA: cation:proton antiporter [Myxococcaceae bacterium]|nr:cation:proton antiporter [Myxococcaceae bacterium]
MKGAAKRLGLLLALLAVVSGLKLLRDDLGTPITLAGAALLLCGIFAGKIAAQLGLPRLTGYLLIGVLVGPYVLRFIPREGVSGLDLVKGLAVSLIALSAGAELELERVRRTGARVLWRGVVLAALVFAVSAGALLVARPFLPFLAGLSWPQALAVTAMTATVIVSFSPTVTIAIVQETRARGPFTEFLMTLVIVGDLVVLLAFALAVGATRAAFGGGFNLAALFGGVGWELFGSIAAGGLLGLGVLVYLKKVRREIPLFITAVCFISAEAGLEIHLSPLLLSLAAGALVANLDSREAHRLAGATQMAALPVFALFFATAGAGLKLDVVARVGPVALVLVLLRAGALYFGSRQLIPREEPALRRYLWMGLVSQAGVTFGLAALIGRSFPSFGAAIEVLIVAMVSLHELVGPVLTRRALLNVGEVGEPGLARKAH